jgi:hypothetical protein
MPCLHHSLLFNTPTNIPFFLINPKHAPLHSVTLHAIVFVHFGRISLEECKHVAALD